MLVTGGAGFIGSHVAEAYISQGREVWIADDLSTGRRENVPPGARFERIDISDARAVAALMRRGRFELVSHQAAQVDIRKSVEDPAADARVNILGLINVAACASAAGVGRLLFASSGGAIYGEVGRPAREDDPKHPESPYGIAKLAGERYLGHFAQHGGLEIVLMRYANVYGERQDPRGEAGVVAIFCGRLREGRSLTIFGDGSQQRDYVHVSDVVDANLLLSLVPFSGSSGAPLRAFNVGTGVATNVLELADGLGSVSRLDTGRVFMPARAGELQRSVLDISRIRELGWRPRRRLDEGLARTWAATS